MKVASRLRPPRGLPVSTSILGLLVIMVTACAAERRPIRTPGPAPPKAATTPVPAPSALLPLPVSALFTSGPGLTVTAATSIVLQSNDPRALFVAEFLAGLLTTVGPIGPSVTQMCASIPAGSM